MVDFSISYEDNFERSTGINYLGTKNKIDTKKYNEEALETLTTKDFINTLKDYYTYRDEADFQYTDDADVLDYFYNDRTWRNNNTVSMTRDLANVMSEDDNARLKQFAKINNVYQNLPNFWNDPNRDFGDWLLDFGGALVLDPVNLIGFGVGGQAAKQAYKQEMKILLKGKMANKINDKIFEEASKAASKKAFAGAVGKGALYEGLVGGAVTGASDVILQNTAIKSGVQEDFDYGRLGVSTAFGVGFGTAFGGAFSAGAFKYTLRSKRKASIKNLEDIHNYGFDELQGNRLFIDLTEPKLKGERYQDKSAEEIANIKKYNQITPKTTDDYVKELRQQAQEPGGKPPKEQFNYDRWAEGDVDHTPVHLIKNIARQLSEKMDADIQNKNFQQIKEEAVLVGLNPQELITSIKKFGDSKIAGEMLAMRQLIKKEADDMVKLSRQLDEISLTQNEVDMLTTEFMARREMVSQLLMIQKRAQGTLATALASQRQGVDESKAVQLLINPEDVQLANKLEGNPEAYMRAIAKLEDDNHLILALQNAEKVNKWDLAAEYVNNNLLSSPDTHILNIASGLMQTQWKPMVMLVRSAYMMPVDRARAGQIAGEAIDTYVFQYVYTLDAIRAAYRSFKAGRPILDSQSLKYDSNIRQGQLEAYLNRMVELLTPSNKVGQGVRFVSKVPIKLITAPLRVLSAGDEFMKSSTFKARAAAQVNSRIARENPEVFTRLDNFTSARGAKDIAKYKELASKYMKEYMDEYGQAKSTVQDSRVTVKADGLSDSDKLVINDPLQYAREATYTQPASSQAQRADGTFEGEMTGKITGTLLDFTNRHRWLRALGAHFINTPSNLLRWNFQHLPILGRYQFQMKQMLKKDRTGKFINPEAAAEANARITMGYMLWMSAITAAIYGKTTGGGSRDWKQNKEKENLTGWQPYSYKGKDGRYISLNRLDPFFTPFAVAADIYDMVTDFLEFQEDLTPYQESRLTELSMGMITSITRNLTSKFYTKGLLETAGLFLGDQMMLTRDPERKGGMFFGRLAFKWMPLSGMMRYNNRVNDEYNRELWTFTDNLKSYNPLDDPDNIMPERNMFGEKISRKNGWLFGIGGKTGLWSSPFAMTNFKNTEVAKFFEDREITYRKPAKIDKNSKINLKDLRNKNGQTAYDRWLELKGEIKLSYIGKKRNLKEVVEMMVANKKSSFYKKAKGVVEGEDFQQQMLIQLVRKYEKAAYGQIVKEFPEIEAEYIRRNLSIRDANKSALDAFLNN
jgi:hypothetical protein